MSGICPAIGAPFGYYTEASFQGSCLETNDKLINVPTNSSEDNDTSSLSYGLHNALAICGYIPVIGMLTGLARCAYAVVLCCATTDTNENLVIRIIQFVRGLFEFFGAGLVFLLPDLIVTAVRHREALCSALREITCCTASD